MTTEGGRRHVGMSPAAVGAFVALTFAISWAVWLPLALTGSTSPLKDLGAFGPALAAIIVVASDRQRRRSWLRALGRWRVSLRLYAVVLLAPALVCLAAVLVAMGLGVTELRFNDPGQLYLVLPIFVVVLVIGGPLGEEPGWRGLLQPALARRARPGIAGLLVGGVWAIWHLPLFAIPGTPQSELPVSLFFAFTIALGVVYGRLSERSAGSVPLAIVFHAASNTAAGVLPVLPGDAGGSVTPFALVTAAVVLTAGSLLLLEARHLVRVPVR